MSKASMARAIAKAGKKQEAQTRGLTGNRNQQGDFMPESEVVKAVEPDLQNYIEDVKSRVDEIDNAMKAADATNDYDRMHILTKQKRDILSALKSKLRENGEEMPAELDEMLTDAAVDAYDPADIADEYYGGDEMRRLEAEDARLDEAGRRKFSER